MIGIPRRLMLIRIVLTGAFVISMLLSFNLWFGPRSFPRTPLIHLPGEPFWWEAVTSALLILFLLSSMFFRWQRLLMALSITALMFLILLDLNRLQPWVFLYGSMLFVFVLYNGRVDDDDHFTTLFIVLQVVFVSVYFFAGLHFLLNPARAEIFRELLQPLNRFVSDRQFEGVLRLSYSAPWVLMFTAVGLLIPSARFLAIFFALFIHLLLLWLVFPTTAVHNSARWLVNVTMLCLLPLLCSGRIRERHFNFRALGLSPAFYLYMAVFVAVPVYNLFAAQPSHLPRLPAQPARNKTVITLDPEKFLAQPSNVRSYCTRVDDDYLLDYELWCLFELRSGVYDHGTVVASIRAEVEGKR